MLLWRISLFMVVFGFVFCASLVAAPQRERDNVMPVVGGG